MFCWGEVYNVWERLAEGEELFGEGEEVDSSWYEYEVYLQDENGEIIASWDSFYETYNGVQHFNRSQAEEAVKEITTDINEKGVDPAHWFRLD